MSLISLITDFGTRDEYVGVLKAVILGIDPSALIVDVSHEVEPQDVVQAAYLLESSYRYFPPGSIHVVVVDPGVGTERRILYLEAGRHRFLAPDNGALSMRLAAGRPASLRHLENPALWRAQVGSTFHGRDMIAPVAAYLSKGGQASEIGPEVSPATAFRLENLLPRPCAGGGIRGRIIHVDRFGNLITNIDWAAVEKLRALSQRQPVAVAIGDQVITGISRTYADAAAGRPLALIGSRGYLEIAVNRGSAQTFFGARKRDGVEVKPSA
jgi:S-adenosyl-L-methionine hydrolase (adenosine-forming)